MDATGIFFVFCLFVGLCVFLSGICLLMVIRQHRRLAALHGEVAALERQMRHGDNSSLDSQAAATARAPSGRVHPLDQSELQARFENRGAVNSRVPEKYRYVYQLERSGLGAGEIADILEVSAHEAEQMLSLARSSRQG